MPDENQILREDVRESIKKILKQELAKKQSQLAFQLAAISDREGTMHGQEPADHSHSDALPVTIIRKLTADIQRIGEAIQNVDQPGFGRCCSCDQPIPLIRLEAKPFATRCVRCQEADEISQQKKFSSRGRRY